MKFSIIIPMHNAKDYIIKALKSIKNQTYKNYECIIIDDHSTDGSMSLVDNYIKNLKLTNFYVKTTPEKKWGPGTARNIGLLYAKGSYILFLDADDEFYNQKSLSNIYQVIDKLETTEIIFLSYERRYKNRFDKKIISSKFIPKQKHLDVHYQIGKNHEANIWSICYKRCLFTNYKIKFPENTIWEDVMTRLELLNVSNNKKRKRCNEITYIYNIRPGKSIGTTPSFKKLKMLNEVYKNCMLMIEEGKINPIYKKDLKKRKRTEYKVIFWMMKMKLFTIFFYSLPKLFRSKKKRA